MPYPELQGRLIVVTGAAGRLAQRVITSAKAEGARVAAIVRRDSDLEGALEAGAVDALVGDLADEASARSCFSTIRAHLGEAHGLIHAAGGWRATPLLDSPMKDWTELLDDNLISTIVAIREGARILPSGGRIIAFASALGADRAQARQGAYSIAKAGVVRIVESAALELRPSGISTFAIAPSTILYEEGESQSGVPADALVELCLHLLAAPHATALSGQVIRAYGTA